MRFPKSSHFLLAVTLVAASCDSGSNLSAEPNPEVRTPPTVTPISNQERLIPISNTRNFRDLGGYTTRDGRMIKWNTLYRADSISHLDADGMKTLKNLNLKVITDLRSKPERAADPGNIPEQNPAIIYKTPAINKYTIDISEMSKRFYAGTFTQDDIDRVTGQSRFMEEPEILKEWGLWIKSLAEPQNVPQLFHCTSGKDRTGFGAAMLMLTLGVPEDQVMDDFLLSNVYLDDLIQKTIKRFEDQANSNVNMEQIKALVGVQASTLENSIAQMKSDYGSIDGFIEKGLGIDELTRQRLRKNLLE